MDHRFNDLITTEDELRELFGTPGELAIRKELRRLDRHASAFVDRSPFALLGTVSAAGACDVSPRGDPPGFVKVLDERTLVLPDRPGNKRFDSLRNIVQTKRVGLLFLVPGVEETLRVNGHACLTRDEAILDRCVAQGKRPGLAIAVEVDECYFQCAKALKRSRLWQSDTWPPLGAVPSLAQILHDQVGPTNVSMNDLDASIQEGYAKRLY